MKAKIVRVEEFTYYYLTPEEEELLNLIKEGDFTRETIRNMSHMLNRFGPLNFTAFPLLNVPIAKELFIDIIINSLIQKQLIVETPDGVIKLTRLGKIYLEGTTNPYATLVQLVPGPPFKLKPALNKEYIIHCTIKDSRYDGPVKIPHLNTTTTAKHGWCTIKYRPPITTILEEEITVIV